MKTKKNFAFKIILFLVIAVVLGCLSYVIFWNVWKENRYNMFIDGVNTENCTVMQSSDSFSFKDNETNINYHVKKPFFLEYEGNLAVGENGGNNSFLLIWPGFNNDEYTYGYSLYTTDNVYSIEVNRDLTAVEPQYAEIVEEHKEELEWLFDLATEQWGDVFT